MLFLKCCWPLAYLYIGSLPWCLRLCYVLLPTLIGTGHMLHWNYFIFWYYFSCLFFLASLTSVRIGPYLDYHFSCTQWASDSPYFAIPVFDGREQLLFPFSSLTLTFCMKIKSKRRKNKTKLALESECFSNSWKLGWRNGNLIGTKKELEIWNRALSWKGFPGAFDIEKSHEEARNNTLTELCNCLNICQDAHLHQFHVSL